MMSKKKLANQVFLGLIVLEGKEPVSKRAEKSLFEKNEDQRKVLEDLITNRLLVSKGEEGKLTVEVAHEALLRSWPVLQNLIREQEENLNLRKSLEEDANKWQKNNKASSELWNSFSSDLQRVVELQKKQALPNLSDLAKEFIDANLEERERQQKEKEEEQKAELERQKRDKRTAQGIAVGSVGALVISSSLGLMAWQKTRQAELNQAESLGRESLSLFNENKTLEARIQAIKAGKILHNQHTTNPEGLDSLLEGLLFKVAEKNRLQGHKGSVNSVSYSPDGKTLASGSFDKTVKLWEVETGKLLQTLKGHEGFVNSVSYSPDGKTLASGSWDNTVKIWDLNLLTVEAMTANNCDLVRDYLKNPNSDLKEEDRHLCDGIGTKP
jgi:hypothetical protein